MQLILLLALLWLADASVGGNGKKGLEELFEPETMELIKEITGGDGRVEEFMNEVKEISGAVTALAPLARSLASQTDGGGEGAEAVDGPDGAAADISRILQPVRNIADGGIYAALSHAVAEQS